MKFFKPIIYALGLIGATSAFEENFLIIKYRPDPVDVDEPYFEYLDTSKSSVVRAAWYDAGKQYMIINLNRTNYRIRPLNFMLL